MNTETSSKAPPILTIDKENFDQIIQSSKFILIYFYTRGCEVCTDPCSNYMSLVQPLADNNPPVTVGRVEIETNDELLKRYTINTFPSFLIFRDGYYSKYFGELDLVVVVTWAIEATKFRVKELESFSDYEEFSKDRQVTVVGFFDNFDSREARVFQGTSFETSINCFALSSSMELMARFEVEPNSIALLKSREEPKVIFKEELTLRNLKRFIKIYSQMPIATFRPGATLMYLRWSNQMQFYLLVSAASGHMKKYVEPLREVIRQYRHKIQFIIADPDDEGSCEIYEKFGLETWMVPKFRIIHWQKGCDLADTFMPTSEDFTVDHVSRFLEDYFAEKITKYYPSQKLSFDWNLEPLIELVGENFDEIVFDTTKDVLVHFYRPDYYTCVFSELGILRTAHRYEKRQDVVVARINVKANQLEHANWQVIPTTRLYKKGNNEAVDFGEFPSYENFSMFMESRGELCRRKPGAIESRLYSDEVYCDLH